MKLFQKINNLKLTAFITGMLFVMNMSLSLPVLHAAPENNPKKSSKEILGTLELFPSSDKNSSSIIFIQDAHANFDAQARICEILKEITPLSNTKTILVEGTSLGLNPEVFNLTTSDEVNKKIATRLAKKGLVTGTELFTLEPESSGIQFSGLEDEALYQKEREAFKTVIRLKRDTKRAISVLDSRLEALKARTFNSALKDLDRKFTAYEKGRLPILGWFDSLREVVSEQLGFSLNDPMKAKEYPNLVRLAVSVEASKHLDPAKLDNEKKKFISSISDRADFVRFISQLGTDKEKKNAVANNQLAYQLYQESKKRGINWLEFPEIRKAFVTLLLSGELAGEGLFREMENLKDALYSHLAKSEKETEAIALDKDLRLMKDALSLESTRDVWNEIKARKNEIGPQAWLSRFKKIDVTTAGVDSKLIAQAQSAYESSIAFYELAESREQVFMQRIQSALGQNAGSSVIVIGGGFHTEGLKRSAEENNLTLAVIQPRLGGKSDITNYYRAVFESMTLAFATSKMSAKPLSAEERFTMIDPEQPGDAAEFQRRLIQIEIDRAVKSGAIKVTEVNKRNVIIGSAQSLGSDSDRLKQTPEWMIVQKVIREISNDKIDLSSLKEDQVAENEILRSRRKRLSVHGGGDRFRIIAIANLTKFEIIESVLEASELPPSFRNELEMWVKLNYREEWQAYLDARVAKVAGAEKKTADEDGTLGTPESNPMLQANVPQDPVKPKTGAFDISEFRRTPAVESARPSSSDRLDIRAFRKPVIAEIPPGKPAETPLDTVTELTTENITAILDQKNIKVSLGKNAEIKVSSRDVLDQFALVNAGTGNPVFIDLQDNAELVIKFGNIKIIERMSIESNSSLEVARVNEAETESLMTIIQLGKNMAFTNRNAIQVGRNAQAMFNENTKLSNMKLVIEDRRTIIVQQNTRISGVITALAAIPDPEKELPQQAFLIPADSEITFTNLTIGPNTKIISTGSGFNGTVATTKADSQTTFYLQTGPDSSSNLQVVSQPRPLLGKDTSPVSDLPQAQAGSLGAQPPVLPNQINPQITQNLPQNLNPNLPDVPVDAPLPNIPNAPRVTNLPPAVINNPRIPPLTPGVPGITFNDSPGSAQDFRTFVEFIETARVLPPVGLAPELEEKVFDEIETQPAPYPDLFTSTGIIAVPGAQAGKQANWQGILAKISDPAKIERLSRLIHDLRNQRVSVNVGLSDPEGFYSLNNPEYRQSIADTFVKNPNFVARFVHLGPESELAAIREFFIPYGERFAVVLGTPENWDAQVRAQMGEDLLQVVQRLDAGKQIQDLKTLYSGHIAVVLTEDRWQSGPELPMQSIVKVKSAAKDKALSAKLGKDPNGVADVSGLETRLSEFWSLRQGNYREILQFFPEEVLTFSEGRIGLNTQTLLQARVEEIHQFMLAIEKLAYQA